MPTPPLRARAVRLLAAVGVLAVVLLAGAAPAWAHGRTVTASSDDNRIVQAPATEAVDWRVVGGDDLVVAHVHGDVEVVVLGYEGEPYLRLRADGAWENVRSPATARNRARDGRLVPERAAPDAEPAWRSRGDGPAAYAWHDHRLGEAAGEDGASHAHEGGGGDAAGDAAARGERVRLGTWEIPVLVDGEPATVRGERWWQPGPSPWPYVLAGLAVTAPAWLGLAPLRGGAGAAAGVPSARWPAGVVAVLVVANGALVLDEILAVPLPLGELLRGAGIGAAAVAVAALGVAGAWRGGRAAFAALAVAGGAIALGQGLGLWPSLSASQLVTLWPATVVRLLIGANLAVALPVAVVARVGDRRVARQPTAGDPRHVPAGS